MNHLKFSLYPWALKQEMPCGPGLFWERRDKDGNERSFYVKKQLISGTSMGELRYLHYLMNYDIRFKDTNGIPYTMEHAYYRGQVEIAGYKVDGYVETADKIFVIEYNGNNSFIYIFSKLL